MKTSISPGLDTAKNQKAMITQASRGTVTFDPVVTRDNHGVSAGLVRTFRVLCTAGAGLSSYLAWTAITTTKVFGCGGSVFDCSHALNSRWSTWFGIPVGVPAIGLYIAAFVALVFVRSEVDQRRNRAWMVVSL